MQQKESVRRTLSTQASFTPFFFDTRTTGKQDMYAMQNDYMIRVTGESRNRCVCVCVHVFGCGCGCVCVVVCTVK